MTFEQRLRSLMLRVAKLEQEAPSEEGAFYDNPLNRSVRELAESKAISNDLDVAEKAVECVEMKKDEGLAEGEAILAPPTPNEIKQKPGGKELSTLNQFIVDTEEDIKGVPKGHDEAPKAEKPPKSLEEGREDAIEEVLEGEDEREVSTKEKVDAIKNVMDKKAMIRALMRGAR